MSRTLLFGNNKTLLIKSFFIILCFIFILALFIQNFAEIEHFFASSHASSSSTEEAEDHDHHHRKDATAKDNSEMDESSSSPSTSPMLIDSLRYLSTDQQEDLLSIKSPLFDIKTENDIFCQSDPSNCYSERCYSPPNYFQGGCLGSPYYSKKLHHQQNEQEKEKESHNKKNKNQTLNNRVDAKSSSGEKLSRKPMILDCPSKIDEKEKIFATSSSTSHQQPPPPPTAEEAKNDPINVGLHHFKKQTSWMFPKWFDWTGKCARPSANNTSDKNFIMRGFHSKNDGLYRLQNVCVQPSGSFIGYSPSSSSSHQQQQNNDVFDPDPFSAHHQRRNNNFNNNGNDPRFEPWAGLDDLFYASKRLEPGMNNYLKHSRAFFKAADKPAPCYLDTKVFLFPIGAQGNNIGHMIHRFGSALRGIESAFGRDAAMMMDEQKNSSSKIDNNNVNDDDETNNIKDNNGKNKNKNKDKVTIMYLVMDGSGHALLESKANAMTALYEALGSSWFSVSGARNIADQSKFRMASMIRSMSRNSEKEIDMSRYACFKEIVVWQNSRSAGGGLRYGFETGKMTAGISHADVPGAQTSFQIHGPRTSRDVDTAEMINERLRTCANLPPKRKARSFRDPNLKIVIIVRRAWRRFLLQPYMVGYLGAIIEKMKKENKNNKSSKKNSSRNISLQVVELSSFKTFRELIAAYSSADVLIGIYGAGLTFNLFMPPGSLTIEINFQGFRFAKHTGLNRNPVSEFGGTSVVSGNHHLVFADNSDQIVRRTHFDGKAGANDMLLGKEFVDLVLEKIDCLMFYPEPDEDSGKELKTNFRELTTDFLKSKLNRFTDGFQERNAMVSESAVVPVFSTVAVFANNSNSSVNGNSSTTTIKPKIILPSCKPNVNDAEWRNSVAVKQMSPPGFSTIIAQLASVNLLHSEKESSSSSSSGRLRSLIKHRSIVARALEKMTKTKEIFKALIVEPCEARFSVLAESVFLRSLFPRSEHVVVAEYAAGKNYCNNRFNRNNNDGDEQEQEQIQKRKSINELVKKKSGEIFQKQSKLQEYYIKFCEYPCNGAGPFHVIFHDCHDESTINTSCIVQSATAQKTKVVKKLAAPKMPNHQPNQKHVAHVKEQDDENTIKKENNKNNSGSFSQFPLPSASQVFHSKGMGPNSVLFAFLQHNQHQMISHLLQQNKKNVPDLIISRIGPQQQQSSIENKNNSNNKKKSSSTSRVGRN